MKRRPGTARRRLLLVLAAAGMAPPASGQTPARAVPEIVTSGSGTVVLPPDRAVIRIGVATRASTAAAASIPNGPLVTRVRDTLRTLGLPVGAVRALSFGVLPIYDYQSGRRLVEYEARTTLEVLVRALGSLGGTLDAVLAAGATDISSISFESDTAPAARRRALALAFAGARTDAEALAQAAGGRLGPLLLVTTSPSTQDFSGGRSAAVAYAEAPAPSGVPEFRRDVVLSVALQTRWAFVRVP